MFCLDETIYMRSLAVCVLRVKSHVREDNFPPFVRHRELDRTSLAALHDARQALYVFFNVHARAPTFTLHEFVR